MKTAKVLRPDVKQSYECEFENCPSCNCPLVKCEYRSGRKIVQTLEGVRWIEYQPKACVNEGCRQQIWGSAGWQQIAPMHSTYGYDVIAQIGWSRQKGHQIYREIHAELSRSIQISESQVRYLYTQRYLPLLACHEQSYREQLQRLSEGRGLILTLDGLAPEGGEAQLWLIRELQSGLTLRSGWMSQQSQVAFENFLQPIVDAELNILAVMSDKQRGLFPAIQQMFPHAKQALCQAHYLRNMAEPVAEADQAMKVTLRKAVRTHIGDLIRDEAVEGTGVLTVTGLLPTPEEELPIPHLSSARQAVEAAVQLPRNACALASNQPLLTPPPSIEQERDAIVQEFKRRVRYLLTLKGRPPLRLAGVEMVDRLTEVVETLDILLVHAFDPRLQQIRHALDEALSLLQDDYQLLRQLLNWLNEIAALLDPDGFPLRSGDEVRQQLFDFLDKIRTEVMRPPIQNPLLLDFLSHFEKVSLSYSSGIFHTYDFPLIPRTNNDRESEFRDLNRRLLSTTGQLGVARRTIQRTGAWELIPTPSSFPHTVDALSRVQHQNFLLERLRLRTHLLRFRQHSRSARLSSLRLLHLQQRWLQLPPDSSHPK